MDSPYLAFRPIRKQVARFLAHTSSTFEVAQVISKDFRQLPSATSKVELGKKRGFYDRIYPIISAGYPPITSNVRNYFGKHAITDMEHRLGEIQTMAGMHLIEGRLKGRHLNGIGFSPFSTLHVPTAHVHGDSALFDAHPFERCPANVIEFVHRVCTGGLPFRSATRWGDGIISDDAYGVELAVPSIQGSPADKMSFSLKTLYTDELDMLLRAELAYKSPAFYLVQFAELPIVIEDFDISIKSGVAATLIAGGATLLSFISDRQSVPLKGGFVSLEDATAIANGAVHHEMALNASNFIYESPERGYGYSCDGLTIDEAPDLSVKFASDTTHITALHGHVIEGPSITILQNIPISAYGVHGNIEPIVRDLVLAAANMCPTLPIVK